MAVELKTSGDHLDRIYLFPFQAALDSAAGKTSVLHPTTPFAPDNDMTYSTMAAMGFLNKTRCRKISFVRRPLEILLNDEYVRAPDYRLPWVEHKIRCQSTLSCQVAKLLQLCGLRRRIQTIDVVGLQFWRIVFEVPDI